MHAVIIELVCLISDQSEGYCHAVIGLHTECNSVPCIEAGSLATIDLEIQSMQSCNQLRKPPMRGPVSCAAPE